MSKRIRAYKVTNLSKVNTTLYREGDHFISKNSIGVLVNGEIKTIANKLPDLSVYAKKTDIPDVSGFATKEEIPDVSGFATKEEIPEIPDLSVYAKKDEIPDVSSFLTATQVQQMIDDAISNLGGEGGE